LKLLHLADLHFGKIIHGLSLLDSGDQPYWTDRLLEKAGEVRPDAVVIAGDVYDRSSPSGDAVALLDRLLTGLAELHIPVMLVAGNHDSGQRLSFGNTLLARQQLYLAGVLRKGAPMMHVTLRDEHGPVTFWLLPYVFPALAAHVLEDETIRDYDTALRRLLERQEIDFSERNVLVAHQNVTCGGMESPRGGSESMVGGVEQIDVGAFEGFDYVALGHIHAAYPVGRNSVRYAGSPLCYHFNETKQPKKGPLLVELGPKGTEPVVKTQIIPPLHPMRELRGAFSELQAAYLAEETRGEYLRMVLTDQRVTPEIADLFRSMSDARESRLLELVSEYDPFQIPGQNREGPAAPGEQPVEDLFAGFYEERCGEMPDENQAALLHQAGELTRNGDERTLPGEKEIEALLRFALEQEDTP